MPLVSRRAFAATVAALLPTASLVRLAHAAAVDHLERDPRTLRALGAAVLPSELGDAGIAAAVREFERWIAGYREGAELVHGYGTSTLERAGPTPATRWATQLDALDVAAQRAHARPFAAATVLQRRALVQSDLARFALDRLPPIGRAPHVALALLAHFYGTAEATDLCYGVRIMRQHCRPLAASTRAPLPLLGARRA